MSRPKTTSLIDKSPPYLGQYAVILRQVWSTWKLKEHSLTHLTGKCARAAAAAAAADGAQAKHQQHFSLSSAPPTSIPCITAGSQLTPSIFPHQRNDRHNCYLPPA